MKGAVPHVSDTFPSEILKFWLSCFMILALNDVVVYGRSTISCVETICRDSLLNRFISNIVVSIFRGTCPPEFFVLLRFWEGEEDDEADEDEEDEEADELEYS